MSHKVTSILLTASILSISIWMMIRPLSGDTRLTTHGSDDWFPSITQTSDGKIWVVWQSPRTGNASLIHKTYNGTSWSPETPLTNDTSQNGHPSIMQTSDERIWVVWTSSRTGNYDLFYKISSDGGSSWSPEAPLTTDPNDDEYPSIVQAVDGNIWVVWTSNRTGNDDIFYKKGLTETELTDAEATPLTTDPNGDMYPSIVQAVDGNIWVVWTSDQTGNDDLFYKISFGGGSSWSPEAPLTTHPDSDSHPSVMQASDGNIWVAWESDRNAQWDIYFKVSDGLSWSPENYVTWHMANDVTPSIFQAENGTILLVWASDPESNFDIYSKFVIPDMAIKKVTISSTVVSPGESVDIHVYVQNAGTVGATFQVTAYYNETSIGTQNKTSFPSGIPLPVTFTWDTTGFSYGYYNISATVSTSLGETNLTNNSFTGDIVTVTIPGDVNCDGWVDIYDAAFISSHWYPGPPIGPLGYDPNADINNDGNVDIVDVTLLAANWEKSWWE
ncbi:MAG: exo-alpha-sialidase [Desulfobacterales bacterium]|nr:exo-alpha-sialidase [Desulfobacterales bacterium]